MFCTNCGTSIINIPHDDRPGAGTIGINVGQDLIQVVSVSLLMISDSNDQEHRSGRSQVQES